jgi:hypothetical protein
MDASKEDGSEINAETLSVCSYIATRMDDTHTHTTLGQCHRLLIRPPENESSELKLNSRSN